jgi:hypothetical protein
MHAKPWPMAEAGTMVQFASYEACCATQATARSTMGFVRDVERSGAEVPAPVPRTHMDRCNCRPNAGTTFFRRGRRRRPFSMFKMLGLGSTAGPAAGP